MRDVELKDCNMEGMKIDGYLVTDLIENMKNLSAEEIDK